MRKKICIIGAGGFAREVLCLITDLKRFEDVFCFMETDEYYKKRKIMDIEVRPISDFNPDIHVATVAIGDPQARESMVKILPENTQYETYVHPNAVVSKWNVIGEGSIICAGCVVTCNIELGKHTHLNLNCTVGHDSKLGDYFTAAPSVNISGNCIIGNKVYLGTSSAVREKTKICDEVVIGMGGIAIKDINESGIYVGLPLKKLN